MIYVKKTPSVNARDLWHELVALDDAILNYHCKKSPYFIKEIILDIKEYDYYKSCINMIENINPKINDSVAVLESLAWYLVNAREIRFSVLEHWDGRLVKTTTYERGVVCNEI